MSNPLLTLPPAVGNKYYYDDHSATEEGLQCEIVEEKEYPRGDCMIYRLRSENGNDWWVWPDGKAYLGYGEDEDEYIAELVEDISISPKLSDSPEFKQLKGKIQGIKNKLKELGA